MDFEEYYRRRHPTEFDDPGYWWHPRNPVGVAYRQQLERAILWAVAQVDQPIEELRILDVGCGSGWHLRYFVELGADPSLLKGVDILESRVARATMMNPAVKVMLGDAGSGLPFADGSFDLVTQFVALSSILDRQARARAAAEMVRVTRPGGWLFSYDMTKEDPGAVPDGVTRAALDDLFPGVTWSGERRLHRRGLSKVARSPLAAALVERTPLTGLTNLFVVGRRTR